MFVMYKEDRTAPATIVLSMDLDRITLSGKNTAISLTKLGATFHRKLV